MAYIEKWESTADCKSHRQDEIRNTMPLTLGRERDEDMRIWHTWRAIQPTLAFLVHIHTPYKAVARHKRCL